MARENSQASMVRDHNRRAWNRLVEAGHEWTVPASDAEIERAFDGDWAVYLTELPVPRRWFPDSLRGLEILCLACGGGQQAPILAAAGAKVTVLDASERQLAHDIFLAERFSLHVDIVEGEMTDLSMFNSGRFDMVFLPTATCFIPEVQPVWNETSRVLKAGGLLLSGLKNPVYYALGHGGNNDTDLRLKYSIPYSDIASISEESRCRMYGRDVPLEFGHTLSDLIGGQLRVGFVITDLYEDSRPEQPIAQFMYENVAIRSRKECFVHP